MIIESLLFSIQVVLYAVMSIFLTERLQSTVAIEYQYILPCIRLKSIFH